uniref:NADH-ubiquinone oxidoreductase chain 5 n=1 Tax=Phyllomimus detersus TaxID=948396 RepID=A0A0N9LYL2_9ORTH|nr:NADH dehydrogenase subunit 5 [Phyllomimus detersus]ALG66358.1 NADH dehydrogenase subunit 5 [Phyllomimus detersus]
MFLWLTIDKVGCGMLALMSMISMVCGVYVIMFDFSIYIEWELFSVYSSMVVMTILFDWMSLIFMGFVMFISSLVIYYSGEYMLGDLYMKRFVWLVLMFVLSMMFLIISPNIISILLGWDGLGLVSYCLVIYYQNLKSYSAGMLTALSNRVGDVALLMTVAWMINMGGWNFIFYNEEMGMQLGLIVISLVILAAMTSSAQIPFSSWLPAAMAAPTPVSALVHSSTLVTAGVYLLIRFNKMVVMNTCAANFLLMVGVLTMFMSGVGANLEFDLSKIIALSTLSQLGLMMGTLGMGGSSMAFFHLLTHALFKALLFMCAGVIIHVMMNCQDIRYMGGLSWYMPITTVCFNIATLALCGMPFLAGFYSKDLILEYVMLSHMNMFVVFMFMFSTGLTVSYSLRLSFYSMSGDFNYSSFYMIRDYKGSMLSMMVILMMGAVLGGSVLGWLFYGTPMMVNLPSVLKMLVIVVTIIGGMVGYLLPSITSYWYSFFNYSGVVFLGSMWFMPNLTTKGLSLTPLVLGDKILKVVDQGWSEEFGGQGFYKKFGNFAQFLQLLQDNSLKVYLLSFVGWMLLLIFGGIMIGL